MTQAVALAQQASTGVSQGFKNRIINGAMVINQRSYNATPSSGSTYTLDRWASSQSQNSKFSVSQNAGSVTPPVGYINYLGCTSTSAYTVGSAEEFIMYQPIEGLNCTDLAWGTANAKTVTLSFQVYSSLTGTFGGSLRNGAADRSYPFSYTISSANTWTSVSVTIAGDTSGTWLTTNGVGIYVSLSLGAGSTRVGTAGAWAAGSLVSATGATSVVGTNGATFYITGVQLEVGSTATSFDYRPYGTELALCQRYFRSVKAGQIGFWANTTLARLQLQFVGMRATPNYSVSGVLTITDNSTNPTQSSAAISDNGSDSNGGQVDCANFSGAVAARVAAMLSSSAGSVLISAEL